MGIILMDEYLVSSDLGFPQGTQTGKTNSQLFEIFYVACFSSSVSTEAMKRASPNENTVMSAVSTEPFLNGLMEVGMVQMKITSYFACSPDGIVVLDLSAFDIFSGDGDSAFTVDGELVGIDIYCMCGDENACCTIQLERKHALDVSGCTVLQHR